MFQINIKNSGEAIYLQLKEEIIRLACIGVLRPDDQLPSVRQLARELGINPNTVSKAYQELENGKIIYSLPGKGSFIATDIFSLSEIRESAFLDFTKAVRRAKQLLIRKEELTERLEQIYDGKDEQPCSVAEN